MNSLGTVLFLFFTRVANLCNTLSVLRIPHEGWQPFNQNELFPKSILIILIFPRNLYNYKLQ